MSKPRTPTALSLPTNAEKAELLDELVMSGDELRGRAEHAARLMLARSRSTAADAVAGAVPALDQEELATARQTR
jgi:hypothetical protein